MNQMKVIDQTSGRALGVGQLGEICLKGPSAFQCYWNNPKATEEVKSSDGWVHTGDIGYYDQDGDVFFVQRSKELIKYLGHHVIILTLNHWPKLVPCLRTENYHRWFQPFWKKYWRVTKLLRMQLSSAFTADSVVSWPERTSSRHQILARLKPRNSLSLSTVSHRWQMVFHLGVFLICFSIYCQIACIRKNG